MELRRIFEALVIWSQRVFAGFSVAALGCIGGSFVNPRNSGGDFLIGIWIAVSGMTVCVILMILSQLALRLYGIENPSEMDRLS
jgi:hypothetical protein